MSVENYVFGGITLFCFSGVFLMAISTPNSLNKKTTSSQATKQKKGRKWTPSDFDENRTRIKEENKRKKMERAEKVKRITREELEATLAKPRPKPVMELQEPEKPISDPRASYRNAMESCIMKAANKEEMRTCVESQVILFDLQTLNLGNLVTFSCIKNSARKEDLSLCMERHNLAQQVQQHATYPYPFKADVTGLKDPFAVSLVGQYHTQNKTHYKEGTFCSVKDYKKMQGTLTKQQVICGKRAEELENKLNDLNKKVDVQKIGSAK